MCVAGPLCVLKGETAVDADTFLQVLWDALEFPYSPSGWDGANDWIRDLEWISPPLAAVVYHNPRVLMTNDLIAFRDALDTLARGALYWATRGRPLWVVLCPLAETDLPADLSPDVCAALQLGCGLSALETCTPPNP